MAAVDMTDTLDGNEQAETKSREEEQGSQDEEEQSEDGTLADSAAESLLQTAALHALRMIPRRKHSGNHILRHLVSTVAHFAGEMYMNIELRQLFAH